MSLAPGTRLGDYEVLALLGTGGMGEVYRARDVRLRRDVALKVLSPRLSESPEAIERFEREARSISTLRHPGIVTLLDEGIAAAGPFLAMELVEGRSLRELLRGRTLPLRTVLDLATQVAEALAAAHAEGVVHRDLKPENVMVTPDRRAKLLDFGLARLADGTDGSTASLRGGATPPGRVLGSAGYMSPEQVEGREVDARSDQFALGALLHEMATGKRAFTGRTAVEVLDAILNDHPRPLEALRPGVPEPLGWIVERCLAKDPADRYDSTRDLARDLARLRDRVGASGSGVRLLAFAPRPAWWAAPPLAGAVLALGVLLGRTRLAPPSAPPRLVQLTFRDEELGTARFAPGGEGVTFTAQRAPGKPELFTTRPGSLEPRPLGLPPAELAAVSRSGETAIRLVREGAGTGLLALVPAGGGGPRELLEEVAAADFSPDGSGLAVLHLAGATLRLEWPAGRVVRDGARGTRVRVSPDGARIALDGGDGRVVVLDRTGARLWAPAVSPVSGFAWGADGDELLVTAYAGTGTDVLACREAGDGRRLLSLPGRFDLADAAPGGRLLLARVDENASAWLLPPGGRERGLSWLDLSIPADLAPDGSRLLFTESGASGAFTGQVYLAGTDGAPAVRLGPGTALSLSPDGRWALAFEPAAPSVLALMPTGPGTARAVGLGDVVLTGGAELRPGGTQAVVSGALPGRPSRLFLAGLDGRAPRPITPEGVSLPRSRHVLSPDGRSVAARDASGRWAVYAVDGDGREAARLLPSVPPGDEPIQWTSNERVLLVLSPGGRVDRLDLATGRREPWRSLPAGPSGSRLEAVVAARDGRSCAWASVTRSSRLFVVDGAR